jgi:hypothetical protein
MAKAISIHVGVNRPAFFPQSKLTHCEDDADAMFQIAQGAGFTSTKLLGNDATFDKVVQAIHDAAQGLDPTGTFLFTFSGHGTQRAGSVTATEPDGNDETIVLADHFLFDSFWRSDLWPRFKPGMRAIAVADCCHGGGVYLILHLLNEELTESDLQSNLVHRVEAARALQRPVRALDLGKSLRQNRTFFTPPEVLTELAGLVVRMIPQNLREKELKDYKDFYGKQLVPPTLPITLQRLFLLACEEGQDAVEGAKHGAFTQALLDVWNNGKFAGNYRDLITEIASKFSGTIQHPNMKPDPPADFSKERPFTI